MSVETDPQVVANNQRIAKADPTRSPILTEAAEYENRQRLCARYADYSCMFNQSNERRDEYYRTASTMSTVDLAVGITRLRYMCGEVLY